MRFNSKWGIPHPSRHARKRYIERAVDSRFHASTTSPDSDDVARAVLEAYHNGQSVKPPHGKQADVIKYNHGRKILLLRLDTDITTVIRSTSLTEPATRKALERTKAEYAGRGE